MFIIKSALACLMIMVLLDATCATFKLKKKLWLHRKEKQMHNHRYHHHYYHHYYHPGNSTYENKPKQGNEVNTQKEISKALLNINQQSEKYLKSEELDKFIGSTEKVFVETDYYKYNISQAVASNNAESEKHKNGIYKLDYKNDLGKHEKQNNDHIPKKDSSETPYVWQPLVYGGHRIKYTNTNFGNTATYINENIAQDEDKVENFAATTAKVYVETDDYKYNITQQFTNDNGRHESKLNPNYNGQESNDNKSKDQIQEKYTSKTQFVWQPIIINENQVKYSDTIFKKTEEKNNENNAQHESKLENYDGTTAKVYVETDDYKYNISQKLEDDIADNGNREQNTNKLDYNNGQENTDIKNNLPNNIPKKKNEDKLQPYFGNTGTSFVETDYYKYTIHEDNPNKKDDHDNGKNINKGDDVNQNLGEQNANKSYVQEFVIMRGPI